ncbi:reprolysin-like metallopeptidase [Breoghania sp. L-A4]|uniref:reprolysin-like metallopeptidase n=1 Tax=Breoghania sp. L-A4 TaxID=2304600 RepID=UPI000E35B8FA|nr:M12 family metallo-peptidase [Breoghania sp. L-A4]AXS42633.1 matrix metalloproteinase-11 [Breoghania sp. L-A4]
MAKRTGKSKKTLGQFDLATDTAARDRLEGVTHIYHGGARCETETRGYPNPKNRSPLELVLDATKGFIPLWDTDVTLNWRFQEQSLLAFQDPEAVKSYMRDLLGEALLAWGNAIPVRFSETSDPWDFEIVVSAQDNCNAVGCTLARAFFPDAGQHEIVVFPRMLQQDRAEQVETMAHELGHVFGLRHFFANVSETAFPSEVFGTHNRFTIMNYGSDSTLTKTDREDLIKLYQAVWTGLLTHVNGTPIRLFRPYSSFRQSPAAQLPFPLAAARDVLR